ncbi:MAG: hypothetical protein QOJ23_1957 [Actinomycetota bacterium]|jgi:arylsulfatase A-like enzyme|nr:hypothetical protein [Actinomycetota bacterium]
MPYSDHINVPLMARWDGVLPAGVVDHRLVGGEDFLPTYYDLRADPWENRNLLADTDPHNDPDVDGLSARLRQSEHCAGTTGPDPCP